MGEPTPKPNKLSRGSIGAMSRYDWGEPKIPRVNPEDPQRSKSSEFWGEGTGPLGHEG